MERKIIKIELEYETNEQFKQFQNGLDNLIDDIGLYADIEEIDG